jgi:hypothetical protein
LLPIGAGAPSNARKISTFSPAGYIGPHLQSMPEIRL